ncbi:hypothetical protein CI109_100522 [Kwoniella shandongensis]|uniref:CCHC-type domain-containing protein n=1 Tax=Kwoniella shandongensis TaxID=1734106 RepID=A0A5M6BRT7_9TREE|nr:uncharacterized protein CI109_007362 [Kwoniella shandongensis]KAA5524315.1 hypothetical protein CI109_007362 [Kwoniella shandongensis]
MARFTSIGLSRKKFVASAAEEAQARTTTEAGPSSPPPTTGAKQGGQGGAAEQKKKKRRGRDRIKDETGKRVAIGEKKGNDAGKRPRVEGAWGRDEGVAKRARLSVQHADDRAQRRVDQKNSGVTCFACRGVGHAARECPNILLAAQGGDESTLPSEAPSKTEGKTLKRKSGKKGGDATSGKCYRCNGTDHSLHTCPVPIDPANPTPFATCYICLASGHLASLCPSNGGKGIYVNGGACKVCGSVAHRAKDCPDDKRGSAAAGEVRKRGEIVLGTGTGAGADEDDFMVEARETIGKAGEKVKRKKHAPAKNGERPAKGLRAPVTEDAGSEGVSNVEQNDAGAGEGESSVPLTARKAAAQSSAKPKPKVISF